ncbi:hypothetical protein [Streptomyces sp. ADI92-24]|uniref:hypothetical protein n=1 Tax=unclassified Streptomyces TaxID=2593676 RepID=UPI000F553548|nr:hypothetical protein [Streptomyces sp. ADI92-24]
MAFSRVRDDRGRAELLARARRLHAAACAAEEGKGQAAKEVSASGEWLEPMREAKRLTEARLAESARSVRSLLGVTARLQSELDDALRRAGGVTAVGWAPSTGPEPGPSAQSRPGAAEDDLVQPSQEHAVAREKRDVLPSPAAGELCDDRQPDAQDEASGIPPGAELVLRDLYLPATRDLEAPLIPVGANVEVRRADLPQLRTRAGMIAAGEAKVVSGRVVSRADNAFGGRSRSPVALRRVFARVPLYPGWQRRVLFMVCVVLVLGAAATSLDPMPSAPRAESAAPFRSGRIPEMAPQKHATGSPLRPPVATSSRLPPGTAPSAGAPSHPSAPVPSRFASEAVPSSTAPLPAEIPKPSGSGVYAVAADGRAIVQWSGADAAWVKIGGPAKDLYAGPAGVFATDPETGELPGYTGVPGDWTAVSARAVAFAMSGRQLYRLAADRNAVHRWNRARGTWTRIGGPAGRLYDGGAGLFATDPVDGRIFAYGGKDGVWFCAGTAGADFAVSGDHLYGLNPERSAVMRWSGKAGVWSPIGGPAGELFAGLSDLYVTNYGDGGLWRYRAGAWSRVGDAGAAYGTRGDHLYRLDRDRAAVREWDGTDWLRIGGRVRTLVVAE